MKIILASQSPQRKDLMDLMNLKYEIIVSDVDETFVDNLPITEQSKRLAYIKAKEVFNKTTGDRVIIGSDSMVIKNDKIYGKPKDEDDAFNMLNDLQDDNNADAFFMADLNKIIRRLQPFDRFLVQRILIDGEKPGDILDEAKVLMAKDESLSTEAKTDAQFAGYVYTRYNRVRKGLQKQMVAIGYGK